MKDRTKIIFIALLGGLLLSYTNPIGNIITIFIGFVLFIFPKIRFIDLLKNKEEAILWTRIASIFMILSGITGLLSVIANLVNYMDFLLALQFFFWASGLIALEHRPGCFEIEEKTYSYDEDINKINTDEIKMDKDEIKDVHSNKVGIPWLFNISWNNNDEIKEIHFNKIESFVNLLLWILAISFLLCLGVLWSINGRYDILTFSIAAFFGFLIIICPNAIDTKRTKNSLLCARLGGILLIIGTGGLLAIRYTNILILGIVFFVIGLSTFLIGISLIYIVACRHDPKKYWLLKKLFEIGL